MQRALLTLLLLLSLPVSLAAQDSFARRWEQRASTTQQRQPAWPPPLATTFPGLIQVARVDFVRQTASNHVVTWNLDSSKGLNLIPAPNTELDLNLPPYLKHSSPSVADGAGDLSFLLKYRFLASNAQHGNSVASAFVTGTVPTGSYKNGSTDASVAPGVAVGKGMGAFDVQSALSATLPVHNAATLGRPVAWNTTLQAHTLRYFWPEMEFNATFFKGGPNDGKSQTFATPGMLVARKVHPHDASSRLGWCAGAGEQIALSHFHSYNHGILTTARMVF